MITDSQIHVWEVDRPERPWPPTRNEPQLPDGFSAEQAIAQMDAAGVDRAVIVPPTWIGENNTTTLEAAQRYPERFAVMGRFDPQQPDARGVLRGWLDQPQMLGIRMTFRIPPFSTWLDNDGLDWFWAECETLGIPVMVLVPEVIDKVEPIAAAHPGLKLIIDHMACRLDQRGAAAFDHLDVLTALAAYPEVYVKVTSAPCFSNQPYPFRDIEPYLRRIHEAFGASRLMWGADLTRLTSTYRECLDHFAVALPFLSADDREWILGKTAATALSWPE